MKGLGYGKGYQYSHDVEGKVADMDCLPESLKGRRYFHAQESGDEAEIKRRLEQIENAKHEAERRRVGTIPSCRCDDQEPFQVASVLTYPDLACREGEDLC